MLFFIRYESIQFNHKLFYSVLAVLSIIIHTMGYAQIKGNKEAAYDEVSVSLNLPYAGNEEFLVIIKNRDLYLPVADLFDLIKIKNNVSEGLDSVSGFFIVAKDTYLFDITHQRVLFRGEEFKTGPDDMIKTANGIFIKSGYLSKIFGLNFSFSFREITAKLTTSIELPFIMEKKQELMRNNIQSIKKMRKADSTISKKFTMLGLGAADWYFANNLLRDTANSFKNTTAGISFGGILAGGEANIQFNVNSYGTKSIFRNFYHWQYVNNNNWLIKQGSIGRIYVHSIASIFNPMDGIQISNAAVGNRKTFGSYRIFDKTEPGWIVELYINKILVDYVKADAAGMYSFNIPLVYGSSAIQIKIYGPWGEIRQTEQNISIPFNFIAMGKFEYTAVAAKVEDSLGSAFARVNFGYGLSRYFSVNSGVEYLSSVNRKRPIPFINASFRIGSYLLFSFEYAKYVSKSGFLSLNIKNGFQFSFSYTQYEKEQTAIYNNYLAEKKASLSVPLHFKKIGGVAILTYSGIVLPGMLYNRLNLILSAQLSNISASINTFALSAASDFTNSTVYSTLNLSTYLKKNIKIGTQVQFQYNNNEVSMVSISLEKKMRKSSYLNFTLQESPVIHYKAISVGLRLILPYMQGNGTVQQSNTGTSVSESAAGSVLFNGHKQIQFSKENHSGNGRIKLLFFLDLNGNGKYDAGEPRVNGMTIKASTGQVLLNSRDTSFSISNIISYNACFIEADDNNVENIAWKLKIKTLNVMTEPNTERVIAVPVMLMGEVSGYVNRAGDEEIKGIGRIKINICSKEGNCIASVMTDEDGSFQYLGLPVRSYIIVPDKIQMKRLHLSVLSTVGFEIKPKKEGDIVDGLMLTLIPEVKSDQ